MQVSPQHCSPAVQALSHVPPQSVSRSVQTPPQQTLRRPRLPQRVSSGWFSY
jgi:hypothetical protein